MRQAHGFATASASAYQTALHTSFTYMIAASHAIRQHRPANLQGETGLDKTTIAVVASTAAKMGAGWMPVVRAKTVKINGKQLVVCISPLWGQLQTDNQGVPLTEIEYFQTHRCFLSLPEA